MTERWSTAICCRSARFSRASCRWLAKVEIKALSSVEIMNAIVDRIGCKLNVFNGDGVYRRDSNPQFFQTRMGRQFYESTMPELVEQIVRLNELLERLANLLDRKDDCDAAP